MHPRRAGGRTAAYRVFQPYPWGCVDGFERHTIQAYRWVMRLRE